jgi:hypothetical protein
VELNLYRVRISSSVTQACALVTSSWDYYGFHFGGVPSDPELNIRRREIATRWVSSIDQK